MTAGRAAAGRLTAARVLAGVDVGNSTTEVVLAAPAAAGPPRPLAWDRMPTRGRKGTASAARAAAELVRRLAGRAGLAVDLAVVAPQRAVDTCTVAVPRAAPDLAPLVLVAAGARTPGRPGVGLGRPVPLSADPPRGEPVVIVVEPATGFRVAAARLDGLLAAGGLQVAAVLVGADEGVLLARRLPGLPPGVPVLDGVDLSAALRSERLLVEVAEPDRTLRAATDPFRLVAGLGLTPDERPAARAAAALLADRRNAVLGLDRNRGRAAPATIAPAGAAPAPQPGALDRWTVDLDGVLAEVEGRRTGDPLGAVRAELGPPDEAADDEVRSAVAEVLGVPVVRAGSEPAAARAGALTTPGAHPGAAVLDLGGGTLDLVLPDAGERVAAGGGELVTAAVARLAGCSRGAADWVKRGPAARLETPHLLLGEDGGRRFADRPAPPAAVGSLVVPGPAGLLPFSRDLAPAEWRALRLRAKRVALGDNLARLLAAGPPQELVLVGGVAGDDELLRVLDAVLVGCVVGRGDVGGGLVDRPGPGVTGLGHRWAVAYGLTVLAAGPL